MKHATVRSIAALLILFSTFLHVTAQSKRTQPKSPVSQKTRSAEKCAGGWSGVVSFKKTLQDSLDSDEPGIRKSIDRIIHKTSRNYAYTARAVVDGTNPQSAVVSTKVSMTDQDLSWGQEKVFDTCNSREAGHWFIIEGNDDRQTEAQVTGPAKSFNLYVDEMGGTYGFSLQFPDAPGTYKREEHVKRSGHCQPKNNEPFDRSTNEPTKIEGERMSVSGEKVDPKNPDTLAGSKIWGDGSGEVKGFIYEVSWRFTRCPGKLLITDLKFEHPKYPNPDDWKQIPDVTGTIDGNRIRVTATVLNMSMETKFADLKVAETYKGDKWNGARPDEPLPEGEVSLRLEGGEERDVELIWDSEGQSWFDDGRPHLLHRIKAELSENGQKKDEKEKPLNIAPKPLVLVNGVWENHEVWEPLYQNLLTEGHSYQWKARPVGENNKFPLGSGNAFLSGSPAATIYENADRLAKFVTYVQDDMNAWHVDMAAHTTGGLVARLYLHKLMPAVSDARPLVKHLVMLGTPNGGIKCADVFAGKLKMFKETLQPLKEFTNDEMLRFNQYVVNNGGTKVSALAGNPVPVICGGFDWNDGFVTVKSAQYGISDVGQANDLTNQLVDAKNFGNFVKPHLVTGPKGTYPLPVKNDPTDIDRWKIESLAAPTVMFVNAAYAPEAQQPFAAGMKLAPNASVEVEVPVETAPNFGITFMAPRSVSATLINAQGVVVGRNGPDSPLAGSMFRTLFTKNAVASGVWKLRLENTSDEEKVFGAFGWSIR